MLTASTRPSLVLTAVEGYVTYLTDGPLTFARRSRVYSPRTRGLSSFQGDYSAAGGHHRVPHGALEHVQVEWLGKEMHVGEA